ncbi:phospholipid/cholesterol/gamma-HCH transport system substrate-binding protein [Arachidicoccus rhizosphaerae]|jgi:phospholipid/cholesterol/gamma-HCH transport system substrate-binding protein|uniref:Phospholipid/cholesterol/gamma-HCH transport system substrate-binding protein n=1 Tax=Arachidicoccus rhizosphaerae TaxID=551991 RepID=A0A1H3YHY5_9BACT|nr:MlaD family protein [Arachidicoccus rhizosphaerae]SEA10482.1 phospholipid/cholesterol/gamma-HCH transport system substrate-binding protein [Arachidicoccus rhizosphaerae]
MKISNETKIGALTIIAIVLLFLGFNFLKGKSLFKTGYYLYAKFPESNGLVASNVVTINGFQAGTVSKISASKDLKEIDVEVKLNQAYDIPKNSTANISSNPLGASSLEVTLGDSKDLMMSGDTLLTVLTPGLLGQMGRQIRPLAESAKNTLQHIDTVMQNINQVMDSSARGDIQDIVANLSVVTKNLTQTTALLNKALDLQTGAFAGSIKNINSFTKNLADNNQQFDSVMNHLNVATAKFAQVDLATTLNKLNGSMEQLSAILAKANSTDGSLGALLNDKELYNNFNRTAKSLQTLLDDLRVHPKRYVNISVFGRKDKGNYLEKPLPQDSTHADFRNR